ncbi:hypothetical protein N0V90_009958 [Kalmusia sp. IMI 367209]|nr:hypothetical protein N0V90_009958 [Kalmusia sp. IMI 367209]
MRYTFVILPLGAIVASGLAAPIAFDNGPVSIGRRDVPDWLHDLVPPHHVDRGVPSTNTIAIGPNYVEKKSVPTVEAEFEGPHHVDKRGVPGVKLEIIGPDHVDRRLAPAIETEPKDPVESLRMLSWLRRKYHMEFRGNVEICCAME